jgi:hypothetical protein
MRFGPIALNPSAIRELSTFESDAVLHMVKRVRVICYERAAYLACAAARSGGRREATQPLGSGSQRLEALREGEPDLCRAELRP